MKAIFLSSAAVAVVLCGLTSCNTTIGFGRDLRVLGENMEHSAVNKQQAGGAESSGGGYQDTGGAPVY